MIAKSGVELLEICEKHNISLSEYAIRCAHMKIAAMLQLGT